MRKDLILDIDGVLLNYVQGFADWMSRVHGIKRSGVYPSYMNYTFDTLYPQMDVSQLKKYMIEFSHTHDFSNLPPTVDGNGVTSVDVMHYLSDKFVLHAISSAGDARTAELRIENIRNLFDWKDEWPVHILPFGGDKREHLSRFPAQTLFVDDLYKNIAVAKDIGLQTLWFKLDDNHFYLDHDDLTNPEPYVRGWGDALKIINAYGNLIDIGIPPRKAISELV